MKVELDLPESLVKGYRAYARFCLESEEEAMRQVLSDFLFGIIEDGFNPQQEPQSETR